MPEARAFDGTSTYRDAYTNPPRVVTKAAYGREASAPDMLGGGASFIATSEHQDAFRKFHVGLGAPMALGVQVHRERAHARMCVRLFVRAHVGLRRAT